MPVMLWEPSNKLLSKSCGDCWAIRSEAEQCCFVSTQCFQCEICMSGHSFARVCAKGASARPYLEGHEARKNLNLWQAETQEPEATLSYTTVTSKNTSLPQNLVCQSFSIGQMDILDYTWITLERWETGLWDMRMQLNPHILESWGPKIVRHCMRKNCISTFRTARSTTMR